MFLRNIFNVTEFALEIVSRFNKDTCLNFINVLE